MPSKVSMPPAEKTPFPSAFRMFVPSLSWQNDQFQIKIAPKRRVSAPPYASAIVTSKPSPDEP